MQELLEELGTALQKLNINVASDKNRGARFKQLQQQGFGQGLAGQQQALTNLTGMASFVPTLQAGLGQQFGAMGAQENQYAQALQNQLAQSNINAMNLPMDRIQQCS